MTNSIFKRAVRTPPPYRQKCRQTVSLDVDRLRLGIEKQIPSHPAAQTRAGWRCHRLLMDGIPWFADGNEPSIVRLGNSNRSGASSALRILGFDEPTTIAYLIESRPPVALVDEVEWARAASCHA